MKFAIPVFLLATFVFPCAGVTQDFNLSPPTEPDKIIAWLGQHWKIEDWGANDAERYMRTLDDSGWKARMLAMQALVEGGAESIPVLESALSGDDDGLAIFAAQTLGYLHDSAPKTALLEQLRTHKIPAVRLYAADALGMKGDAKLEPVLASALESEKQGDVKKHLGYAIERGTAAVDPSVIETLKNWDAKTIDSAEIGKPAPDFELKALGGETVRLSDFKGKSAVVLIFIYGDT